MRGLARASATILLATTAVGSTLGMAGTPAIDAALASHFRHAVPTAYQHAFADLNGDGLLDAVVVITDPNYCGSGGCTLAILRGTDHSLKYLSGATVVRTPIRVLTESRHGWKSLSVRVSGGGITSGEVLMRFNGRKYPANPTTQPPIANSDLSGATELDFGR